MRNGALANKGRESRGIFPDFPLNCKLSNALSNLLNLRLRGGLNRDTLAVFVRGDYLTDNWSLEFIKN
jgi:hypothetical protein